MDEASGVGEARVDGIRGRRGLVRPVVSKAWDGRSPEWTGPGEVWRGRDLGWTEPGMDGAWNGRSRRTKPEFLCVYCMMNERTPLEGELKALPS